MTIDKESINIVRSYIGNISFMSKPIFGINFSREAIFELYKHEAKIMRLRRNPENQKLKVAFRKVKSFVNYLYKLNNRRIDVRKAMTSRYFYTKGICTVEVSYNDLIAKFGRVKVEVIKIHNSGSVYKVNNVSSDIWYKSSYQEA